MWGGLNTVLAFTVEGESHIGRFAFQHQQKSEREQVRERTSVEAQWGVRGEGVTPMEGTFC